MVTKTINAVLFRPGETFEGFTIGNSVRTGDIQAWSVTHAKGTAILYCKRKRGATEKEIEAFKERAQRLQSIPSVLLPDVIRYGYSSTARCFWLATEDAHGISLKQCFEVSRKLIDPIKCLILFMAIATLLDEAEDYGFHHYALSPEMIYIHEDGEVCCVAGLGMIEVFAAQPPRPTFESTAYCAPDLLRGELSAAADIYAAGMILWELMARREPYRTTRSGPLPLDEDTIDALEALEMPSLDALKVPVPYFVSIFVQRVSAKKKAVRLVPWEQVLNEVKDVAQAWYPTLMAQAAPPRAESAAAPPSGATAAPPREAASLSAASSSEAAAAPSSAAPPSAAPSTEAAAAPSSAASSSAAPSTEAAAAPSSRTPSRGAAEVPSPAAQSSLTRSPRSSMAVALLGAALGLAALAFVLGARQPPASSGAPSGPPQVNALLVAPALAPSVSAPCAPETPTSPALAPPRPSSRGKQARLAETPPCAEAPLCAKDAKDGHAPAPTDTDQGADGGAAPRPAPRPAPRDPAPRAPRDPEPASRSTLKRDWPLQ